MSLIIEFNAQDLIRKFNQKNTPTLYQKNINNGNESFALNKKTFSTSLIFKGATFQPTYDNANNISLPLLVPKQNILLKPFFAPGPRHAH